MTQTHSVGTTQLLNPALNAAERAGGARTAAGSSSKSDAPGTGHASTTLSGTGSLLAASAADADDVRTEKVVALKAAIESGTYHVPASAVADKIIGSLLG